MHSECLIRAGFNCKIVLKSHGKPEGKSISKFLTIRQLRTFIRSEREKPFPLWNNNVVSAACLSSALNDDDMSNIGESWEMNYSIV